MEPSSCELEFFDFKDSSDEEVKEIQAILKGPTSEGCVKLPWENSVKNKCSGSLPENEASETESAKDVGEATPRVFAAAHTVLPPPVAPLPPAVETYVTLPTTVGPYHNTPYFVSRTLPYLRTYPPMGMPIFACSLPGSGEANPYGFVPVTPTESESGLKSQRQSSRRGSSKKRLGSDSPENANPYSDGLGCPTSMPLVPLSVPPSTFVGRNLPMHSYPPGLHTSPTMYYVPVFNHPYGGYIRASGPPMMLPINVATTDLKCPPLVSDERLHADNCAEVGNSNETSPRDMNGGCFESPEDNKISGCELTQDGSVGHLQSPQNDIGLKYLQTVDLEEVAAQSEEMLLADNCVQAIPTLLIAASAVKDTTLIVRSDCKSSSSPDVGDNSAKTVVPEHKEMTDYPKSPPPKPPNTNCFPETEDKCLEEKVVSLEVPTKDASNPVVVQLTSKVTTVPTKVASSKEGTKIISLSEATEAAKPVVRQQPSRCWADLFKGPSEVNGFGNPPEPNSKRNCKPPEQANMGGCEGRPHRVASVKRDITNGEVPSSSLH